MDDRKSQFIRAYNEVRQKKEIEYLIVAVKLPNGAIEIITNTVDIMAKMTYYDTAYDKDLCLRSQPLIQIVNWMVV